MILASIITRNVNITGNLTANGNVGIGTTDPTEKLYVQDIILDLNGEVSNS